MRDKAIKALISMGIPMTHKGFGYIADAMELYEENGQVMTNMALVYNRIAKKNEVSWQVVEKDIRYAFSYAFDKGVPDKVAYYIGVTPQSNGNRLAILYYRLGGKR